MFFFELLSYNVQCSLLLSLFFKRSGRLSEIGTAGVSIRRSEVFGQLLVVHFVLE